MVKTGPSSESMHSRIESLRSACEDFFGEKLFRRVYSYMRSVREDDDPKQMHRELIAMVGEERIGYVRKVEVLLGSEDSMYR